MKRKVIEINDIGHHYEVIRDFDTNRNPYSIKKVWYDCGWHRKTLVRYQDMASCMYHLLGLCTNDPRCMDTGKC